MSIEEAVHVRGTNAPGSHSGPSGTSISTHDAVNLLVSPTYDKLGSMQNGQRVITYSFSSNSPTYTRPIINSEGVQTGTYTISGMYSFNADQKDAALNAMQKWESITNIHFVEVDGHSDLFFVNYNHAEVFNNDNYHNGMLGAAVTQDWRSNSSNQPGDVGIYVDGTKSQNFNLDDGGTGLATMLHEIGHSLGLRHPGLYNQNGSSSFNYKDDASYKEDSIKYTVMSYFGPDGADADAQNEMYGNYNDIYARSPTSPMMDDILAIRSIYGSKAVNLGNDTYGFNSNLGSNYNIKVVPRGDGEYPNYSTYKPIFSITDQGGNDTLNFFDYKVSQFINLNEGGFSDIGGGSGNVSITPGTIIENAIGGDGDDVFYTNLASNFINGNCGTDTAYIHKGSTLVYISKSGKADFIASTPDGGITIDYDVFYNVENLKIVDGNTLSLLNLADGMHSFALDSIVKTALKERPAFSLPNNAFDNPPYSPLILDLDGDGVEVSNVTASTTMFDMNLDGFAERTAWVRPDDALLALDRNGNGIIDDSSELFGSNTTNGFVTLAALDSNQDGSITSADARFSELSLWRDANSDGKTDAGEIASISAYGITAISLSAATINEVNAGNPVTHRSTFTQGDGSTGRIDDVWFRSSLAFAHDKATDAWTPSAEVAGMPTLVSYGKAHNLLWAMDHNPTLKDHADALIDKVTNGDMTGFRADFQIFVMEWLGVNPAFGKQGYGQYIERSHYDVLRALHGSDMPYGGGDYLGGAASNLLELEYQHAIDTMAAKFVSQVSQLSAFSDTSPSAVLDAFSPTIFSYKNDSLGGDLLATASAIGALVGSVGGAQAGTALHFLLSTMDDGTAKNGVRSAAEAAAAGSDAVELAIFKGYAQATTIINQDTQEPNLTTGYANVINGTSGNDGLNADAGSDLIDPGTGDDTIAGASGSDTVVYRRGYGNDTLTGISSYGEKDRVVFASDIRSTDVTFRLMPDGASVKVIISATDSVTLMNIVNNPVGGMTLEFGDGVKMTESDIVARFIVPTEGDDDLAGGAAAETINAGAGNDMVHGNGGNDTILGGAGNDTLYGGGGDDTIQGGTGDDTLYGGDRNDTYAYNIGDGNDRIYARYDTYADYGVDKIVMGPGITAADLTFSQSPDGHDLIVTLAQGGSITIVDGFWNGNNNIPFARIGSIVLEDGTAITPNFMLSATLTGNDADNVIHAVPDLTSGSIMSGGEGDDSIYGGRYDDMLTGGSGEDFLDGHIGNDSITGGTGDDIILTGPGNDTIHYSLGDGNDTVTNQGGYYDYGTYPAGSDRIVFGVGIAAADLSFTQSGTGNLVVRIGQSDSITIQGALSSISDIPAFHLADGNVTSGAEAARRSLTGSVGNDVIWGTSGADTITGGLGNDTLKGQAGADTYVYARGDGDDTIDETGDQGAGDVLTLGSGIVRSDVRFVGGDVPYSVKVLIATGGSVTILGQQGLYSSQIESLRFADGSVISRSQMSSLSKTATSGDDVLWGDNASDAYAYYGNDTLSGADGNDRIYGGGGSDSLSGGNGNDFLDGDGVSYYSADTVHGDAGNDTLVYDHLDALYGDAGQDVLDFRNYAAATIRMDLGGGSQMVSFIAGGPAGTRAVYGIEGALLGAGNDVFIGNADANLVVGGAGDDVIDGGDGDDVLQGGLGSDILNGGAGNDTITVDGGDVADGGVGTDTLLIDPAIASGVTVDLRSASQTMTVGSTSQAAALSGFENVTFGAFDDVFRGGADANVVLGNAGSDTLYGYGGADSLNGGEGADVIDGGDGNDVIIGSGGADTLIGGSGMDVIYTGTNAYTPLSGYRPDADVVDAGEGDDTIYVGSMGASGSGGTGSDTLAFMMPLGTLAAIYVKAGPVMQIGTTPTNVLQNWTGIERFTLLSADGQGTVSYTGYEGTDIASGSGGADVLRGYAGNDLLNGGGGRDTLDGGDGNDTLQGGAGNDTIAGGAGSDTAVFEQARSSYTMTTSSNGTITVTEAGTGYADTLSGIEYMRTSEGMVTGIQSPIVLDLNGDGVHLLGQDGGTIFDMDADGTLDLTGWMSRGDAVLVLDQNADGIVNDGSEMSFVAEGAGAATDMQGLRMFDLDGNGRIDSLDPVYASLRLWADDGDGISQAAELLTLEQAGIQSIGLATEAVQDVFSLGDSLVFGSGSFIRQDGTSGELADAAFTYFPGPTNRPAAGEVWQDDHTLPNTAFATMTESGNWVSGDLDVPFQYQAFLPTMYADLFLA